MSFRIYDEDKGIRTMYWVYLDGVSLDFDSRWMEWEVEICRKSEFWTTSGVVKGRRRCVGPRSLEWVPATPCHIKFGSEILVQYGEGNGVPPHTSVIAGWGDVKALAQGAEYQHGSACLEIKADFLFGVSTVRLIVRKVDGFYQGQFFKLSVVIENIRRDEWNKLLEYQQKLTKREDFIVRDVGLAWRGNEHVIEQTPESPWQDDRDDVTNNVRHVALESLPLVLKYLYAQSEAIQRGLSYDDFQWEFPNYHETRIVRPPSAHTDTPLRALRLDLRLPANTDSNEVVLYVSYMKLNITAITRSPSLLSDSSVCTLRLDARYAALANVAIPNYSSQIVKIPTDSRSTERVITTNGLMQTITVNVVQIVGSVTGDIYGAPIHGGNVGGRNNINNITTPTPDTPSRRKGDVSLLRRFEFLPGLRAIFRSAKRREGEARVQEGATYNE